MRVLYFIKWLLPYISYSRFARDVTVAMLVYRTIAKKIFWIFDSVIMQNLSDILPLFCSPTWPFHHVSENQQFPYELKSLWKIEWSSTRPCVKWCNGGCWQGLKNCLLQTKKKIQLFISAIWLAESRGIYSTRDISKLPRISLA